MNNINNINNVDNSGSNGFSNVLRKVTEKGVKLMTAASRTVARNFPGIPPMCTPLMRVARPLVETLAQPVDTNTFPELPSTPINNLFETWSPERVEFFQTHCTKRLEECMDNDVVSLEDEERVFVARSERGPDITVEQARNFGFILPELPEETSELAERNPNLKIKPLMIRCFGVGSGSTGAQIQEGIKNILSLPTDRLELANTHVLSYIESEQQRFKSDPNVLVVPFITGFSLGGMFASAIAVKNNFSSIVVNGLGLGKNGCEFVGKENWKRAQQQSDCHAAMFVDHDFVASPDASWRGITRTPGCIFCIPWHGTGTSDRTAHRRRHGVTSIPRGNPTNPTFAEMREIHCDHGRCFDEAYQEYIATRDRLVA
ncbi:MAG: hypothetical protein LBD34_01310 [Puniceicoccales bacterium]|nr:hypothetical protein [Puniceicoccales bacterium]